MTVQRPTYLPARHPTLAGQRAPEAQCNPRKEQVGVREAEHTVQLAQLPSHSPGPLWWWLQRSSMTQTLRQVYMPVDCMVLRPRCSPKAHTLTPGRAAQDGRGQRPAWDLWKEASTQVRCCRARRSACFAFGPYSGSS